MEKSKNFGNVSVKLLCSVALLTVVGCVPLSAQNDGLNETYSELVNQRSSCFEQSAEGSQFFPASDWLANLKNEEKQLVVSYLSQYAFNKCLEPQVKHFEQELAKESPSVQRFIKEQVAMFPYIAQKPDGIDEEQLHNIEINITMPFIASEVYESLK
ncbi:hypothetical protein DYB89_18090 [Vibrio cholerae]|nr:hypothetical protein [Vibrio cholerae]